MVSQLEKSFLIHSLNVMDILVILGSIGGVFLASGLKDPLIPLLIYLVSGWMSHVSLRILVLLMKSFSVEKKEAYTVQDFLWGKSKSKGNPPVSEAGGNHA